MQKPGYPDNFNGVNEEENTYLFEIVVDEIPIQAYSEEGAEEYLKENLSELLMDAYYDGKLRIY